MGTLLPVGGTPALEANGADAFLGKVGCDLDTDVLGGLMRDLGLLISWIII
jgi:hypothetical protein